MSREGWKADKNFPLVQYRIDKSRRKVGVNFDRYFRARFKVLGETHYVGFGWWSEEWTASKVYYKAIEYKENVKAGRKPTSWIEEKEMGRKKAEAEKKKDITFSAYWRETYYPDAQVSKTPSSYLKEKQHVETWLAPSLGKKPLREISPDELTDLRNTMLNKGKAPRTVQHVFSTFRLIWNHAKRRGVVHQESPTRLVQLGRIQNERTRFLTAQQVNTLLEHLKARDQLSHDLVLTALSTGARAGELFNLTWDMVDLQNDEIRLVHTKTGEPRTIPMLPELKEMFLRKGPGTNGELVFIKNGRPLRQAPSAIYSSLNKLFNEGVKDRRERITFHSMRHTAASHMLKAGVDVRTIQALFGWSTLQMLQRYSHVVDEQKRKAIQGLGQSFKEKPAKVLDLEEARKKQAQ